MTFELKIFLLTCIAIVVIGKLYLSIENMILRVRQQKEIRRLGRSIIRRFRMRTTIRQRRRIL